MKATALQEATVADMDAQEIGGDFLLSRDLQGEVAGAHDFEDDAFPIALQATLLHERPRFVNRAKAIYLELK
ncbi:hypothetical protein GCM10010523_10390 [Paenarthrobacter ilicis]